MSQRDPRPGTHAWDESDSRSIASHTSSYNSRMFVAPTVPVIPKPAYGVSATGRLASALMGRLRARGAARECARRP